MVPTTMASASPARLRRSSHLSYFGHMGAVYLFHDLYGYLMEMSPDVAELIEAFGDGADTERTMAAFAPRLPGADPREFVDVLVAHAILLEPDDDERESLWAFVPIRGKWNVWQRRGERHPRPDRPALVPAKRQRNQRERERGRHADRAKRVEARAVPPLRMRHHDAGHDDRDCGQKVGQQRIHHRRRRHVR